MSKKDKIQLGITGFLAVIFIFTLIDLTGKKGPEKIYSQIPEEKTALSFKEKFLGDDNLYKAVEKKGEGIKAKRNPFSEAERKKEEALTSGLILSGIVWDKNKPKAVINGRIVKVGDVVGGKTVTKIEKDRVIFLKEGRKSKLEFRY